MPTLLSLRSSKHSAYPPKSPHGNSRKLLQSRPCFPAPDFRVSTGCSKGRPSDYLLPQSPALGAAHSEIAKLAFGSRGRVASRGGSKLPLSNAGRVPRLASTVIPGRLGFGPAAQRVPAVSQSLSVNLPALRPVSYPTTLGVRQTPSARPAFAERADGNRKRNWPRQ